MCYNNLIMRREEYILKRLFPLRLPYLKQKQTYSLHAQYVAERENVTNVKVTVSEAWVLQFHVQDAMALWQKYVFIVMKTETA